MEKLMMGNVFSGGGGDAKNVQDFCSKQCEVFSFRIFGPKGIARKKEGERDLRWETESDT